MLISTLIIFVVGVIVDLIRQLVEKYTVDKFLNSKYYEKITKYIHNISRKIIG